MRSVQTPSFIIRKASLHAQTTEFLKTLSGFFPRCVAGYSFKTNNFPWIISFMRDNGLWAEVVSSDEYSLAKSLDFPIDKIIFNGPVKGQSEFVEAVENGAIVNIDSKRELRWLKNCCSSNKGQWKIGLRVNFDLESRCPGETQGGGEDGRFGFSLESGELSDAMEYMKQNNFPISGIHLHCSSKTRSLNIYRSIAEVAVGILKAFSLNLDFIDIGGGYFGGVPGKPTFREYFDQIKTILSPAVDFEKTTIIVEPGISLVGSTIDYMTRVIDVKRTKNNTFTLLDGSRIHIDPLMRKSQYTYHVEQSDKKSEHVIQQILCGFTCMENDRFFHLEYPPLKEGDAVIFEKVGAYTMGFSPQFIAAYPPVYVDDNGRFKLVREKQKLPI